MWLLPLALGAAGGLVSAAGNIYGNAQDPLNPRIRDLKAAQARGQLTAQGQALANQGYAQAGRALTENTEEMGRRLAAMGGSSGADIAALHAGSQKATADLYSALGQNVAKEMNAESQELTDLKALRRQRAVGAAQAALGAAAAGAQAGAAINAYKKGGGIGGNAGVPEKEPDLSKWDAADQATMRALAAAGMPWDRIIGAYMGPSTVAGE